MGGKWDKNRITKPRHVEQMQEEILKVNRQNAESEALQDLLRRMRAHPFPGDYRTQSGYHVRITHSAEEGIGFHLVPPEKQQLEPGALWLPSPPVHLATDTPVSVDALWVGVPGQLWAVKPQQVGFNDLGEALDGKGNWCRYYQLRQMTVKWVDSDGYRALECDAVSSVELDLTRPYLSVYASGGFEEVLPVQVPGQWMAAPTQSNLGFGPGPATMQSNSDLGSIPDFDPATYDFGILPATAQQLADAVANGSMNLGDDFSHNPDPGHVGQKPDALNPSGMPQVA